MSNHTVCALPLAEVNLLQAAHSTSVGAATAIAVSFKNNFAASVHISNSKVVISGGGELLRKGSGIGCKSAAIIYPILCAVATLVYDFKRNSKVFVRSVTDIIRKVFNLNGFINNDVDLIRICACAFNFVSQGMGTRAGNFRIENAILNAVGVCCSAKTERSALVGNFYSNRGVIVTQRCNRCDGCIAWCGYKLLTCC